MLHFKSGVCCFWGKHPDYDCTPLTPPFLRGYEQLRQPCGDMLLSMNKHSGNRSDGGFNLKS